MVVLVKEIVVSVEEMVALVEEVVGEVAELQLQLYHLIHKKIGSVIMKNLFYEIENIILILISDPN
jgi:hypothetical protein